MIRHKILKKAQLFQRDRATLYVSKFMLCFTRYELERFSRFVPASGGHDDSIHRARLNLERQVELADASQAETHSGVS